MKIIVDTSVWIEYLKNQPEVTEKIDNGFMAGTVYLVGPVVSELLQGARTGKDYEELDRNIDGVPFLETRFADWKLAGCLSYRMRKKGYTVPITDCLIAAIAINNASCVYSFDRHFQQIPDVRLTTMERAGT